MGTKLKPLGFRDSDAGALKPWPDNPTASLGEPHEMVLALAVER